MRLGSERGEGRIGFMLTLIIVVALVFVGVKVIPVRVDAYSFRDTLREEARMGAVRDSSDVLAKRIMRKAEELDIPLDRKNLKIRRTPGEIIITAQYEQPIDLKFTTYVYRFRAKESAPLF